jgi:hypothetical protein
MADFGIGETALALEAADAAAETGAAASTIGSLGAGGAFIPAAGVDAGIFSALPAAGEATAATTGAASALAPAQEEIAAQNLANVTGQPMPVQGGMQPVSGAPQSFSDMAHAGQTLTDQGWQAAPQGAPEGIQQVAQTGTQVPPQGMNQIVGSGADAKVVFPDGTSMPYADWAKSMGLQNLTPPGGAETGSGIGQFLSDYKTPLMIGAGMMGINALVQQGNRQYGIPAQTHYTGPLSKFSYNPATYTPTYPTPSPYTPRYAAGGIAQLNVGGKLLKGGGDGMSDSIQANIGGKQQARLADGEFVVPADVVSHLGNGSTDAGAKQLYSMMDKVRQARVGTKKQGKQINPKKYMPA